MPLRGRGIAGLRATHGAAAARLYVFANAVGALQGGNGVIMLRPQSSDGFNDTTGLKFVALRPE